MLSLDFKKTRVLQFGFSATLLEFLHVHVPTPPPPQRLFDAARRAAPRREVVVVRKHAGHLRGTNVSRGPAAPSSPILSAAFFARRAVRRHS